MAESNQKAPAATIAHVIVALIVVGLFVFPFVAKFGFESESWFQILLGHNRVFLFWAVGYGLLIGLGFWADRNPEKVPSWLNKRIG